jgi:hypothetical protein
LKLVEDIFEQAEKLGVTEIIPSTMGEPLIYTKSLIKFLSYRKKVQHQNEFDYKRNISKTEKTVLEWAKLIVPITTDVKISWNGATAETSKK